jgi:hypothetical protein
MENINLYEYLIYEYNIYLVWQVEVANMYLVKALRTLFKTAHPPETTVFMT